MPRIQRIVAVALIAALSIVVFTELASAQNFRRVDGSPLPTICVRLVPQSGPPSPPRPDCGALPILEDGWVSKFACLGPAGDYLETESYVLSLAEDQEIVFVDKVKLAPKIEQGPITYQIIEDIFIIPCNPRSAMNPTGENFRPSARPPMLFIDDVIFPPITLDDGEGAVEFLCAVSIPLQLLIDHFGPGAQLDWFALADMDSTGQFYGQPASTDVDGDGVPDSCIELTAPGKFIQRQGIDEKGADLVLYLLNRGPLGLTDIEVFEPTITSLIPPLLPGMSPGEEGITRPWCFTITP